MAAPQGGERFKKEPWTHTVTHPFIQHACEAVSSVAQAIFSKKSEREPWLGDALERKGCGSCAEFEVFNSIHRALATILGES